MAFWFALRKDGLVRVREQRAAGNAAITVLARMASDFTLVRVAIVDHRAKVLAEQPDLPLWMQVLPMPFKHAENLHFDIEGLTFLFDHPRGADVFNKLMDAEIKYHGFFHFLAEHRVVAEEVQNLLAQHHPDPYQPSRVSDLGKTLGFARVKRVESLTLGLFSYVDDKRDDVYDEALEAMTKLLKERFKKGVIRASMRPVEDIRRAQVT